MRPDWIQMAEHMQELKQFSRRTAARRHLPLTPSELELLSRLWLGEGPATPLGLSRAMGLQQVNVSRLIKGLRERGLVASAPSPADRRSYTLSLTEAGRRALQASYEVYLSPVYQMREALGANGFQALMDAVAQANRCLDGAAERGGAACPSML